MKEILVIRKWIAFRIFYVFSEISVTVYIHNEGMKMKIWNWRLSLAAKFVLGMRTGNVYRRKKSYWILFLSSDYKNIGECVTINCAYKAGCKFISKKSVKKLWVEVVVLQWQKGSFLLQLMQ